MTETVSSTSDGLDFLLPRALVTLSTGRAPADCLVSSVPSWAVT